MPTPRRGKSGIVAYSNSAEARRRWTIAHTARSEVVGHLMDMAGLKQKKTVRVS